MVASNEQFERSASFGNHRMNECEYVCDSHVLKNSNFSQLNQTGMKSESGMNQIILVMNWIISDQHWIKLKCIESFLV